MNIGQKLLSQNSLVKFGITPALGGGIVGGAAATSNKMQDPYADTGIVEGILIGAGAGLVVGGASATSFRAFRDYKLKQGIMTNVHKQAPTARNMAEDIVLGGAKL